VARAGGVDRPLDLVLAYQSLGGLHLTIGDVDAAAVVLERGVDVGRTASIRSFAPVVAADLGYAHALGGRSSDALELVEYAAQRTDVWMPPDQKLVGAQRRCEVSLLAGRAGDAAELARQSLQPAGQQRERGSDAWTLRLLGEIAARSTPPRPEQAEAYYGEARDL